MAKSTVKMLSVAIMAIGLLTGAAPFANASITQFTFTGTITGFDAFNFDVGTLPALASPGDTFIGTAFFNDADVAVVPNPELRFEQCL